MNETKIFALTANKELVNEICDQLFMKPGQIKVEHFADGEVLVTPMESVRGKKCFIIQSTYKPTNDHLMELLVAIDAMKRASAAEITCVIPYYGYARQDRKASPRQPITSKLVADLLGAAGASRVITVELHAPQITGFFPFPADDLNTAAMFGETFLDMGLDMKDFVVVSPDHGGTTRARRLAEVLNTPLAIVDKRRPRPNEVIASNVIGDVKDKNVIVVDDICDTGGSLVAACDVLKEHGAKDIYTCICHGVFSRDAIEKIENSCIKKFFITNSIPLNEEQKAATTKIEVVSIGKLLARIIDAISKGTPISDVYSIFHSAEIE